MRSSFKTIAALVLILCLTILYSVWVTVWSHDSNMATWGGDILATSGSLIATIWLIGAARRCHRETRLFWTLLSIGTFSYFIAEVIWLYEEKILLIPPHSPGWTDLFYNIQIAFYFAAFAVPFFKLRKHEGALKVILDVLIVMTVATTFSWHYLIAPILQEGTTSPLKLILNLSYPITPLALLFGVVSLYLGARNHFGRKTILFLFLGLLIQMLANTAYMLQLFDNRYVSGGFIDPFFMLGLLLVGYAGFLQSPHGSLGNPAWTQKENIEKIDIPRVILPYINVVALFFFMIAGSDTIGAFTVGIGISILLVIVRQIMIMVENHGLLVNLYRKTEELEQSERRYRSLAYHDTLTGLANRMSFEEKLKHTIEEAEPFEETFAIAFIDLDRFKNVNDTLGHHIGDRLLVQVAKRLKKCIRESDFVARQGGDEFTLILRDIGDREGARIAAQRILETLIPTYLIEGHMISTPPSIGLALYPIDDETPGGLMKKADIAMYQVKYGGKGHHRMYCEMDMAFSRKFTLEKDLEQAIENEQLLLHYQPQIDYRTSEWIGVEALLRWNHPVFGFVPPSEFIPIAEDSGQMSAIGEWVLNEACMQGKTWLDAGFPIKIGVNLSPVQLRRDHFVQNVQSILQQTGLPAGLLIFEIAESAAVALPEQSIDQLHALKRSGISICIDNFGIGYSAVSILERLPIDKVKIARPFTSKLENHLIQQKVVSHIIDIARTLNIAVVAEGVEYPEQAAILSKIECLDMQGFLFGHPVPASEMNNLLKATSQS
ncbi:bifunctional diguanylate cyclase/phosphodiesterase [Saccharibacillus sp. JS10]|uniref:putative bifunctional diguanylate cyclase/phosphodiesterase n=1 Tax=Saccharibacillus sp. JS10 TaxID=2950552 RepID=UPI00210CA529|nr:DUF4084 domain-containing protein [Saccharibacillus sp. JS10]MCQ4087936.1 DUF4084 domain-containing protein [Saccharibacillus sp. JS10]